MEKVGISTSRGLADPRAGGIRRSSAVSSSFTMRWTGATRSREALRLGKSLLPARRTATRWASDAARDGRR